MLQEVFRIKFSGRKQVIIFAAVIFICFIIAVKALSSVTTIFFKDDTYTVCIDPGHGGKAIGAVSKDGKRREQDDTLALSLKIRDCLEKQGVRVVMTRDTDVDVSLEDRCKKANKAKADLFVSIHRNSSDSGTGMEVWINEKPSKEEMKLSSDILKALVDASGMAERGVKQGFRNSSGNNYYVNAHTNMPSCLVEVGFITNDEDNKNFDKNIDKYAEAIADAIYKNLK